VEDRGRGFAELQQVEEVGEAWTRRWRRSVRRSCMVPTEVPGCGGEGRVDGTVPGRFDVAERGANVEEQ
jgi:hypothetical protein